MAPDRALAAGRRAISIFESLVREHPDRYEFGVQLSLAQEEIGLRLIDAGRSAEAIDVLEAVRRTLRDMASGHGRLASRMVAIRERIATADINLREAYASDPARYAAASRELAAEAYAICEKLGLIRPLSWNLQAAQALASFAVADGRAEEGRGADLGLILESERIWEGLLRQGPTNPMVRANLVVVRRRLAEELADRGRGAEASAWSRRSLETARGDAELLYSLAVGYARLAGITGTYPTGLDAAGLGERRRRFVAGAIAMLRQAVADGFKDAARMRSDSMLDPIRPDPGFGAILADLDFPADAFTRR